MTIPRYDRLRPRSAARESLPARGIHTEKQVEGEGVLSHGLSDHTGAPGDIGAAPSSHGHPPQDNLTAIAAPGVTNDSTEGYSNGSIWVYTATGQAWVCVDPTADAAVWDDITAGAAGAQSVPLLDGSEHTDTVASGALAEGSLAVVTDALKWAELVASGNAGWVLTEQADGSVAWAAAAGGGGDLATDTLWAAAGDLVKGTGDDTADILSIGAAHSVLQTLDGAAISWQTAPELQYIKDIGGTTRITTAAAAPNVKLGGEVWVYGERMRISNISGPSGNTVFEASARTTTYGAAAEVNIIKASHVGSGVGVSGMGATVRGVFGLPIVQFAAGSTFGLVYGLHFVPYVRGSATTGVYELVGIKAGYGVNNLNGTLADARSIDVDPPSHTGSVHTILISTGIRVGNHGNSARIADAYSVKIEDMTTNTGFQRLLEISSAVAAHPYLRVVGGGAPAANQTNLYVKEQATLRHVQWMDPGAGGANFAGGERVMILV